MLVFIVWFLQDNANELAQHVVCRLTMTIATLKRRLVKCNVYTRHQALEASVLETRWNIEILRLGFSRNSFLCVFQTRTMCVFRTAEGT